MARRRSWLGPQADAARRGPRRDARPLRPGVCALRARLAVSRQRRSRRASARARHARLHRATPPTAGRSTASCTRCQPRVRVCRTRICTSSKPVSRRSKRAATSVSSIAPGVSCGYFARGSSTAGRSASTSLTTGGASRATRDESVEPGHQFEWAWILANYSRLGEVALNDEISALVAWSERHGVDPASGATFNQVRDDGEPLDRGSRTWPNTERLKGHLAVFELHGGTPHPAIASATPPAARSLPGCPAAPCRKRWAPPGCSRWPAWQEPHNVRRVGASKSERSGPPHRFPSRPAA